MINYQIAALQQLLKDTPPNEDMVAAMKEFKKASKEEVIQLLGGVLEVAVRIGMAHDIDLSEAIRIHIQGVKKCHS